MICLEDLFKSPEVISVLVTLGVLVTSATFYLFYQSQKKSKRITLVDPQTKYALKLIEKEEISHDTRRFRFALPSKDHVLGLPVGQHIRVSAKIGGNLIIRSYTPVTSDDDYGHVDLVVKVYFKNVNPKFPDGGMMSQYLNDMKIGDSIDVRGPAGRILYLGNGKFSVKLGSDPREIVRASRVGLIAGGTGITPMLQLIRHITKDPNDNTQLSLLFANQTEQDILVRDELEAVAAAHPDRFKLWYTVDVPTEGWKYSTGFITDTMIKEHLFPPAPDTLILMCGPPPMINFACILNLEKLNYAKNSYYAF